MNLIIIGATGLVGKSLINLLDVSDLPIKKIEFIASKKSKGKLIKFKNNDYLVKELSDINLNNFNIACLLTSSEVAKIYVPLLQKYNMKIIDNSSAFREEYDLTIPEINFTNNKNIYVNPNCCIIQSLIPLYYINNISNIKSIIYNTYQSCSGGGYQLVNKLRNKAINSPIPLIGDIEKNNTTEEKKMIYETKKILKTDVEVYANCVRIPTYCGHLVNIIIDVENTNYNEIATILKNYTNYDTISLPKDINNNPNVFTTRLKELKENTYSFYTYANNLLRGSSYNTYKILEYINKNMA